MKEVRTGSRFILTPLPGAVWPGTFAAARYQTVPPRSFSPASGFQVNPVRIKAASGCRQVDLTRKEVEASPQKVAATRDRTALTFPPPAPTFPPPALTWQKVGSTFSSPTLTFSSPDSTFLRLAATFPPLAPENRRFEPISPLSNLFCP